MVLKIVTTKVWKPRYRDSRTSRSTGSLWRLSSRQWSKILVAL